MMKTLRDERPARPILERAWFIFSQGLKVFKVIRITGHVNVVVAVARYPCIAVRGGPIGRRTRFPPAAAGAGATAAAGSSTCRAGISVATAAAQGAYSSSDIAFGIRESVITSKLLPGEHYTSLLQKHRRQREQRGPSQERRPGGPRSPDRNCHGPAAAFRRTPATGHKPNIYSVR